MDPSVVALSVGTTPWTTWEEEKKVLCTEILYHLTAMAIDCHEKLVDCVNPALAGAAGVQYMVTQDIVWVDEMYSCDVKAAKIGCGHRATAKKFFHRAFSYVDEQNKAVLAQQLAVPLGCDKEC